MTSRERGWLAALAVLAVLALIEVFYVPGHTRWLEALNNAGHIPVFGLLAIALLHLVKRSGATLRSRPVLAYSVTLILAAILGAASELVQYFTPRDADLGDLVRDMVGAASFLALYAAWRDHDLKPLHSRMPRLRSMLLGTTAVLWLAGGASLLVWSAAYVQRWWHSPVICQFDSYLSTRFVSAHGVRLEHDATSDASGAEVRGLRVRFESRDWPGVEIADVPANWVGYDSLVLELTVEGDRPLAVAFAAFDRLHNETRADRFSAGRILDPGSQRLATPFDRIFVAPRGRTMDMEHMKGVRVFSDSTSAGRSVLLERLYLK